MSVWRPTSGRWKALGLQALGDGIAEAAVGRVMEGAPPRRARRSDRRPSPIGNRGGTRFMLERIKFADDPTIGEIAVGCAIGYLEFRMPDLGWRETRPKLTVWYGKVLELQFNEGDSAIAIPMPRPLLFISALAVAAGCAAKPLLEFPTPSSIVRRGRRHCCHQYANHQQLCVAPPYHTRRFKCGIGDADRRRCCARDGACPRGS